jgi:hypothetical protein
VQRLAIAGPESPGLGGSEAEPAGRCWHGTRRLHSTCCVPGSHRLRGAGLHGAHRVRAGHQAPLAEAIAAGQDVRVAGDPHHDRAIAAETGRVLTDAVWWLARPRVDQA